MPLAPIGSTVKVESRLNRAGSLLLGALALALVSARLRIERRDGGRSGPEAVSDAAGRLERRARPTPGAPHPPPEAAPATPGSPRPSVPAKPPVPADSYALVGTALELRGAPYRDGGADPRGFDCSGFTQYVFARHGARAAARHARSVQAWAERVKPDDLAAGDLLFFTTTAPGASHVGIAVGTDQFVHAPSSTGVVRVER